MYPGKSIPYVNKHKQVMSMVTNLADIGEDIVLSPPIAGVKNIVMKFGGSSLATAERVTYVAKYYVSQSIFLPV